MSRSSENTGSKSWLTGADFVSYLEAKGVSLSLQRLRSWREKGLMPPCRKTGKKRHHHSHLNQAWHCYWAFENKSDANFVGWRLWMLGYDVPSKYWRPVIEKVGEDLQLKADVVSQIFQEGEKSYLLSDQLDALLKNVALTAELEGPTAGARRGMKEADVIEAFTTLIYAFAGLYTDGIFSVAEGNYEHVSTLLGMREGRSHDIEGNKIDYGAGIRDGLRNLGHFKNLDVGPKLFAGSRLKKLLEAREVVQSLFDLAIIIHEAAQSTLGPRALGFQSLRRLAEGKSAEHQAGLVLGYLVMNQSNPANVFSINQIRLLHNEFMTLVKPPT